MDTDAPQFPIYIIDTDDLTGEEIIVVHEICRIALNSYAMKELLKDNLEGRSLIWRGQ